MHYLENEELNEALKYIKYASEIASGSSCYRAKCGSIIVKDHHVIGVGYNSPPQNQKLDACLKDSRPENFKSDTSCCVHAEQRAIKDALKNFPNKVEGSRLYFIRLGKDGYKEVAGKPYCTICSKETLDAKIAELVLVHKEGVAVYDTKEYNELSFNYNGD